MCIERSASVEADTEHGGARFDEQLHVTSHVEWRRHEDAHARYAHRAATGGLARSGRLSEGSCARGLAVSHRPKGGDVVDWPCGCVSVRSGGW